MFQTLQNEKPKDGSFITSASPGVVALFQVRYALKTILLLYIYKLYCLQVNKFYSSHEDYVGALASELKTEYRKGWSHHLYVSQFHMFAVIDSGMYLQLDCPDLAMGRHHAYAK